MSYVNTGALVNGQRPATKKALRDALTIINHGGAVSVPVVFDVTSPLGPRANELIAATTTDIGDDNLSVVGPDPYTKRNWYATVYVKNGRIFIS